MTPAATDFDPESPPEEVAGGGPTPPLSVVVGALAPRAGLELLGPPRLLDVPYYFAAPTATSPTGQHASLLVGVAVFAARRNSSGATG